jgi:UDP-glucose 4-epimerase
VVAIFMSRLRDAERPRIFGDGGQTRDYVYAGDVAEVTLAALESHGGVFNVGTGHETSVVDLLAVIQAVTGTDVEPEHADARAGELQRSVLDVSRAEHELGWRARHSLRDGLAETWAWIAAE